MVKVVSKTQGTDNMDPGWEKSEDLNHQRATKASDRLERADRKHGQRSSQAKEGREGQIIGVGRETP